jgi:hypothetical protein
VKGERKIIPRQATSRQPCCPHLRTQPPRLFLLQQEPLHKGIPLALETSCFQEMQGDGGGTDYDGCLDQSSRHEVHTCVHILCGTLYQVLHRFNLLSDFGMLLVHQYLFSG